MSIFLPLLSISLSSSLSLSFPSLSSSSRRCRETAHHEAHVCGALLMCNPTSLPQDENGRTCQIKWRLKHQNVCKILLQCFQYCETPECTYSVAEIYMLCKKPNAYRISSRGCLDSQLTPPKKPGTAPDRRDLSSLPDPPYSQAPPPPGISGRYISPPTAMPFRSSYLLRIPGQAWEI